MYEIEKQQLLRYLTIYINKQFNMKFLFVSMVERLKKHRSITERQLLCLMKFLEREPQFLSTNREKIIEYFSPLTSNEVISKRKNPDHENTNTLTPFFE